MLKYQITLILILIGCIAFVACERTQDALIPVMPDPEPEMMVDYTSWEHVVLAEPAGTTAHDAGERTIFFNEAAAMANKAGTEYSAGSMIYKEAMNADNTMITQIVSMTKTDDPMYADRGGWIYGAGGNPLSMEQSMGCDSCHVKAPNGKYVFVSLPTEDDDSDDMDDGTDDMDDGTDDMDDGADDMDDGADDMDDGTDDMDDGADDMDDGADDMDDGTDDMDDGADDMDDGTDDMDDGADDMDDGADDTNGGADDTNGGADDTNGGADDTNGGAGNGNGA